MGDARLGEALGQDAGAVVDVILVAGAAIDVEPAQRLEIFAVFGDQVDGIEFPEAQQAINVYPITTLKDSKNPALAQAFVDYVLSPDGQAVLAKAGFAQP